MKYLVTGFAKITGALPMWLFYRPLVLYTSLEAKQATKRMRRGGRFITVANHSTVYDFVLMLLIFPFRFLRVLMAEVLFKERGKPLAWFLKNLGGIMVDRNSQDLSFMSESIKVLENEGALGIFPEARLTKAGERKPFAVSAVSIALKGGSEILPLYIEARKGIWRRKRIVVGEPIDFRAYCSELDPPIEVLKELSEVLRGKVAQLEQYLIQHTKREAAKEGGQIKIREKKLRNGFELYY